MGLIFVPFSAITSIFGTQFFGSSGDGHMTLSTDFWILWLVAIPLTAVSLAVWRASERGPLLPRPWGFASSCLPHSWPEARKWIGRVRQGRTTPEAIERRDAATKLV